MFGIGFWELAVIAAVILVFVRPEDLPAFFRKAGRLAGNLRAAYEQFTRRIGDPLLPQDRTGDLSAPRIAPPPRRKTRKPGT